MSKEKLNNHGHLLATLLLSIFCCIPLAQAADDYVLEIGAGMALGQLPEYPGSPDDYQFILPLPYIYYRDESLTIDRRAITDQLYTNGDFSLSLSASGSIPVDSDDDSLRAGMPDLGWVAELGPSLEYTLSDELSLAWQIRKATGLNDGSIENVGWRSNAVLTWQRALLSNLKFGELNFNAQLAINYGDSRYHQYYYGVDDEYARASRLSYSANSGLSSTSLSAGITWRYQQLWLGMYFKHFNLSLAANRQSPLLIERNQTSFGLAFAWIFWTNQRR